MKIKTKDCLDAIAALGLSLLWKRAAKYRVEDPRPLCADWGQKPCWIREFVNGWGSQTDKRIVFVWAFEDAIVQTRVLTPATGAEKTVASKNGYREFVVYPTTAPMVKDGSGGWEEQDFENTEITFVEPSVVVAIHGGDWQEPMDVEYRMMSDGNLYYNSKTAVRDGD